jgi:hypothetical protein
MSANDIVTSSANPMQTSHPLLGPVAVPPSMATVTHCLLVILEKLTMETLSPEVRELALLSAEHDVRHLGPEAMEVIQRYREWAEKLRRRHPLAGLF